jgi:deazaflavin-dependent oxidoreductase (nitroreductase family)
MREDQRAEVPVTPAREDIPKITREHVAAMEASDDEAVWFMSRMHFVLLRTIGRRSGRELKVALPYWKDDDGNPIVVGSYAGGPSHPAWYHNLIDREANPEVLCRVRGRSFYADAVVLEGEDYASTWKALTADRPFYAEYQQLCERQIPLVRLVEKRAA